MMSSLQQTPKVSIVITTHNRVQFLKNAIESVVNGESNTEIIVVDDVSTDGTQEFCESIDGIRYVRLTENLRTAGARNKGIAASTAPYIVFLDDDDWRLPNTLDEQIEVLERHPECGLVYGQYYHADYFGKVDESEVLPAQCPEGDVLEALLSINPIACMTAIVRKDVFAKVGVFDTSPGMYGIEDWDMWLRIAEHYEFRATPKPVAVYRKAARETGQWSSDIPKQFGRVADAYKTKWYNLPRVKRLLDKKQIDRNSLLDNVADRILYDMATNSVSFAEKCSKTLTALKCQPRKLGQITFYKTLLRAIGG